jgi:large subunit ribosomal protein L18Ae
MLLGEIVPCGQVFDKSPLWVKNFGVWLCFDSRSRTHNRYHEYGPDYMGAWHRAHTHSIQIMKVEEIAAGHSLAGCQAVPQLQDQVPSAPPHLWCQHKPCFTAKRPNTFF